MRKYLLMFLLLATTISAMAVPALRVWRDVKQSDGTVIKVMQVGDERFHYYVTTDNVPLIEQANGDLCYASAVGFGLSSTGVLAHEADRRTDVERAAMSNVSSVMALRQFAASRSKVVSRSRRRAEALKPGAVDSTMMGTRRALLLLVDFSNQKFKDDSLAVDYYTRVCNEPGYTNNYGAIGSVHDYFLAQSLGKFDLTFDVVRVTLPQANTWYGANARNTMYNNEDQYDRLAQFVVQSCQQADSIADLDWTQYDWNNDSTAELVFLLYAGGGEATSGGAATIWPHMASLSDLSGYIQAYNPDASAFTFKSHDSISVNVYACSNEVYGYSSSSTKMGLGVICHEFSHCMGLPDLYDTYYNGNSNLGDYDILASGSYNSPRYGLGWVPAGYTAYERKSMNWIDYVVLDSAKADTTITDLEPMSDGGDAFVLYNDGHKDEYFLLENRVKKGWDAYVPDQGLMMMHVDYNQDIWEYNEVNTLNGETKNTHARMAFIPSVSGSYNSSVYVFPYNGVDSITDNSVVPPTLYNNNANGTQNLGMPICNIKFDKETGLVSFVFMPIAKADTTGTDTTKTDTTTTDSTLTGINNIRTVGKIVAAYTLEGRKVAFGSDGMPAGLGRGVYVIRFADGRTRKVLIE